jgi:hypothetical protein
MYQEQQSKSAVREMVDTKARIITDEFSAYVGIGSEYEGEHASVCHSAKEYASGDIHTNTAESSFALVKRGNRRHLSQCQQEISAPLPVAVRFRAEQSPIERW